MAQKSRIEIKDHTRIRRNPNLVFSEVDGEVVMLSVKNGEYYNLNEVSSRIWDELEAPRTFEELVTRLENTYEVSHETCVSETKTFLERTIEKGIITIVDE